MLRPPVSFERSFSVERFLQDTDAQFVIGLSVAEDIAFALENDNATHDEIISKVQRWADVLDLQDLLTIAPQHPVWWPKTACGYGRCVSG